MNLNWEKSGNFPFKNKFNFIKYCFMPKSKGSKSKVKDAYLKVVEDIPEAMNVEQEQGLSDEHIRTRRNEFGQIIS